MKPLSVSARRRLEHAVSTFQGALPGSPAEEYLAGRGLGPAAVEHRLGFVAERITGYERFVGTLAIPNLCATGHVVGVKFRTIVQVDNAGKYDQAAGVDARLFNLRALNHGTDTITITEGELDTVACTVLGIPAVGVPGAQNWKGHHWRLFEGFDRVVVVHDDDGPGRALVKTIMGGGLDVVAFPPPGGVKDVNECLLAGFGDELVRMVNGDD